MDSELRQPSQRRIFLKQVSAVVGAAPLAAVATPVASAGQVDPFGQPVLRITYDFSDNDIKLSKFLTEKGTQIGRAMRGVQLAVGNPRTKPYSATTYQSSHINGGAAIGADPATSVVNRFGQCWDVPNVFVTGAALFPQNSCYNPTGTIGALAYWTADAIRRDYVRAPGRLLA